MTKQLVDCLVMEALRPALKKIFSITWQQGSSSSYCRLHCKKQVKKRLGNCCKEHLPGILVPANSDFSCLPILSRGGLTITLINLVNYVWTIWSFRNPGLFSWCYYSVRLIISHNGRAYFCHFSSDNFEQYTWSMHESIEHRFCNRAVTNVFFINKRKLSTGSAVVDGVKASLKRYREK